MEKIRQRLLITVEGIDGSGKSTFARALAQKLISESYTVLLTREPGASSIGKELRAILQTQKTPLSPHAEFLLFAADRAQHFHEIVIPALDKKTIVVSDRMADSSVVYQGYGRGLDLDMITSVNKWIMQGIQPDITFYLKLPQEVATSRLAQRKGSPTVFEKEHDAFLKKIVHGFDTLFKNKPHVSALDATQSTEQLTKQALAQVKAWTHK